jgi:hypothetical protein
MQPGQICDFCVPGNISYSPYVTCTSATTLPEEKLFFEPGQAFRPSIAGARAERPCHPRCSTHG